MSSRFYEFGSFRIDAVNHLLLRDGQPVPLKPKVFDTLLVLVEHRGRVLDKHELMDRLWPDTAVEESNLTQNVYLLRKVLGEDLRGAAYIETMPKRGYRFVAGVREVENEPNEPAPAERARDRVGVEEFYGPQRGPGSGRPRIAPASPGSRAMPRWGVVAASFSAVALVATLVFAWLSPVPEPALGTPVRSMAVLPFKPLGPDAGDEALGFGMADTLITRLSSIRQLVVRPTSAVRKYASPHQDPAEAGQELHVDAVLEGSIQRVNDRVRVTLRLVRASDGSALWAEKFDERDGDVLAVQDRVAEKVARALLPRMTREERERLARRYTDDTEAYRLYILGRYHAARITPDDWTKAVNYFHQAIEKDPDYALAYTGLADCYSSLVADSLLSKAEAIPKARQAAYTALQLDDTLAEAHVSAGRIKAYYDWDWPGAERDIALAIELSPNSAGARLEYAAYLTTVGRSEQAIAEARKARELDPLSHVTHYQVAWALISARRYDEAIEESQKVIETFPQAHDWIGRAHIGKGRYDDAVAEFEKRLSLAKDDPLTTKAFLGYAYGMSGRRSQAEKLLAEVKDLSERRPISPGFLSMVYAGLGEKDQAFAGLENAYREHSRVLAALKVNPVWDGLRSDARFADLLRRMGLPQ
jgi:DNA-binding winged helix-turn-helix (wHTH) protein/TolB-like protein/Flp pilus assembly protein TadD